jgi:hypothetical protein
MGQLEDVEKYVPRGYHPIDIGNVVGAGDQSYEVARKVGSGGF